MIFAENGVPFLRLIRARVRLHTYSMLIKKHAKIYDMIIFIICIFFIVLITTSLHARIYFIFLFFSLTFIIPHCFLYSQSSSARAIARKVKGTGVELQHRFTANRALLRQVSDSKKFANRCKRVGRGAVPCRGAPQHGNLRRQQARVIIS